MQTFMQTAVELAYRGRGRTKTNPCVGAVIVKDGQIIGCGWHEEYGKRHAEPNALLDAGENATGADIYVTLEPCTTYGKQPPCCNAIIEAGIKRVFIGVLDPNPAHAGRAVEILRQAGIEVHVGIHALPCAELIEDFAKFQLTKRPYITLKLAQSLDGKIATHTGVSQWITSEESRQLVHKMRNEVDGVIVGIGTALSDDPELTVRHMQTDRQPARIVFDSKCRLPLTSKLARSAAAVPLVVVVSANSDTTNAKALVNMGARIIIAGEERIDIELALRQLGELNMMNLMLEGGSTLAGAFLVADCVDKVNVFIAPILIGGDCAKGSIGGIGADTIQNAIKLQNLDCVHVGVDFLFQGKLIDYSEAVLALTATKGA